MNESHLVLENEHLHDLERVFYYKKIKIQRSFSSRKFSVDFTNDLNIMIWFSLNEFTIEDNVMEHGLLLRKVSRFLVIEKIIWG